jgi:cytochrome c-type biogenesis protein
LLTTLNPCVLPILPIVLAGTMTGGRFGPVLFAGGMVISFTAIGLFVASVGIGIGITPHVLRDVAAALFVVFGLVLLLKPLQKVLAAATVGLASSADALAYRYSGRGAISPFVVGALAGAAWAPCSGPSLGAAVTLAAESGGLLPAALRMLFFGLGATTILVALAYGTRNLKNSMHAAADWMRPAAGAVFVAVGVAVLTSFDKTVEIAVTDRLPDWLIDFTTRY